MKGNIFFTQNDIFFNNIIGYIDIKYMRTMYCIFSSVN